MGNVEILVFIFFTGEIYDRKYVLQIENNDVKQISTYKPLLNKNNVVKSHFLTRIMRNKKFKHDNILMSSYR